MKATNFMVVYNDNIFCPEEKLTKSEAFKVLNRLLQRGLLQE